jgi:hypothetical protein
MNYQTPYQTQAQMQNQIYQNQNQMINQGGLMVNMYQQVNPGVPSNNNLTNNNINTPSTSNINPNQNNQGNLNNGEPQPLLPENDEMIGKIINSKGIINVFFEASTGSIAVININKDTPIKEAIEKYAEKIHLNKKYIGKEVIFVLNGKKLDPFSNNLFDLLNKKDSQGEIVQFKINVFDQANVLGA